MTTAVYLRISEDRTGLELGVERQREDCRALAASRGWTDVREFADNDISATTGRRRPGYQELMAAVDRGEVSRIVVWQSSRLWRNRRERAEGIERLKAVRAAVVPVKGPELDMSTAYGRGLAGLLGEFDTMESEVKAERSAREVLQRAEQGRHHGGPRPYGYSADGMSVIDEEAAQIRAWYAALLAGRSMTALARAAGRHHSGLRVILLNPRNAGMRVLNGVEYPGRWPAIVEPETWRATVALLTDPARRSNVGKVARRWVGAGLYRCERCGGRPVESAQNGGGADGKLWQVYRCLKRRGGCGRTWKADRLDAWVTDLVSARLARADVADLLPRERPDINALRAEALALRQRLPKLSEAWALGTLTDEQIQTATTTMRERLTEIEGRLAETTAEGALTPLVLAADPAAAWRAIPVSEVAARQAVIRAMMTITLGASPRGRTPFDPSRWVRIEWRTL